MQITGAHIAGAYFFLIFTFFWMPPVWLLMRFLTPKALVERYFKKPHFTNAELALFSHFPGSLMRTGILMSLCTWPQKGKKRQMTDIQNHTPKWYITTSKYFTYLVVVHGFLILAFTALYAIYFLIIE